MEEVFVQTQLVLTLHFKAPLSRQSPTKFVTPNSCPSPWFLIPSVKTTSKGLLGTAACLNHRPKLSSPAFSTTSAVIRGGGHLAPHHLGSSGSTHMDYCACAPARCSAYAHQMFQIYTTVTAQGIPNFLGAKCPLPSNFNFDEWNQLLNTDADHETIAFLQYSFPASYEGPIPTPFGHNHASATPHPSDIC